MGTRAFSSSNLTAVATVVSYSSVWNNRLCPGLSVDSWAFRPHSRTL